MEDSCEDLAFSPHIVAMVPGQDALLPHHLHGVHLACAFAAHLEHLQGSIAFLKMLRKASSQRTWALLTISSIGSIFRPDTLQPLKARCAKEQARQFSMRG